MVNRRPQKYSNTDPHKHVEFYEPEGVPTWQEVIGCITIAATLTLVMSLFYG